eukprot:2372131-Rhodomonas_salina.2
MPSRASTKPVSGMSWAAFDMLLGAGRVHHPDLQDRRVRRSVRGQAADAGWAAGTARDLCAGVEGAGSQSGDTERGDEGFAQYGAALDG